MRGYDSFTVLRRPSSGCEHFPCYCSLLNFTGKHLYYQLLRSVLQYSLFYLFAYDSAYSNIQQHSTPPPPMSSYSVVFIPQCCISTTVSHCEIYIGLYHIVKQYRPIPHCETVLDCSALWDSECVGR